MFISSITGLEGGSASLPYSAAKVALVNNAKNLSCQVARANIQVNTVAPPDVFFPSGSWECHLRERHRELIDRIEAEAPMALCGTPQEFATLVTFLYSPRASFITGSCLVADGGQRRSL